MDEEQVLLSWQAPNVLSELNEELERVLAQPLDFPPFCKAVIPEDRVTIALDQNTPDAAVLVRGVWTVLEQCGVPPGNVVIIQPVGPEKSAANDPRSLLPEDVRGKVGWVIHNPEKEEDRTYLATTSLGERVYLARDVVDADLVVSVGVIGYDPVIGFRGTNSVFYPGLSSPDAQRRAIGQGHRELRPDDERPLRRMIDDIGWLLGTQFSIQVIPAEKGGSSHVLAGIGESVFQRGKQLLKENWLVHVDARPEIVVVAVDCDSDGHGWEPVCSAMSMARRIIGKGGKIVVLSELKADLPPGLELVRECENARDALRPLQELAPVDLVSATQLADCVDWADVYLFSQLESDLVEDLFIVPIGSDSELQRLLQGGETCVFIEAAQHAYAQVAVPAGAAEQGEIDG